MNSKLYKPTLGDYLGIGLILAAVAFSVFGLHREKPSSADALVYFDDRLELTLPLNEKEPRIVPLKGKGAVLEIKDRKIRILNNDCPEKTCMTTGWISYPGERIICIPKHLLIIVEKNKIQDDFYLDAVAY